MTKTAFSQASFDNVNQQVLFEAFLSLNAETIWPFSTLSFSLASLFHSDLLPFLLWFFPSSSQKSSFICIFLLGFLSYNDVKVKVTHSCLTLCNLMNYTVHGILQVRILQGVAFPFSRGSSQPRDTNLGLPHHRQILYQLIHKGSPRILQWVAFLQVRYSVLYLFSTLHSLCRRAYLHKGRRDTSVVRNTVWPGSNSSDTY